jgi:hypothetical protein
MKKVMAVLFVCVLLCGCDGFRFAAKEVQKQNAWLHWRTTELAAQEAVKENSSAQLQGLTGLASQQSQAFVADYGMPKELPVMGENMPTQALRQAQDGPWAWHPSEGFTSEAAIAQAAYQQSIQRPDIWQAADGAMQFGIALAGLLGGAYGIRATQFLKQARDKSKALKEIIEGNELFKETNPLQASAFKEAQKEQSVQTKKIVTEIKNVVG